MSEKPTEETHEGISRRRMLKRIGAGAAVAWTAPVLTSLKTPAFAQAYPPCPCDLNTPCNFAIDCEDSGGSCNCWVLADRSKCWCGPISPCTDYVPCDNGRCAEGFVCVENCCGQLCYPECPAQSGPRGPRRSGPKYGTL
jgi:hypothetical protein